MGMYDDILIPRKFFTDLTPRESELLNRDHEGYPEIRCQTKDFDCCLDVIVMLEDGSLKRSKTMDYGDTDNRIDVETYSGVLDFYELVFGKQDLIHGPGEESYFIEYRAEYENGKMISVKRL